MPTTPWKAYRSVKADEECLALLSYLPLARFRKLPQFFRHSRDIQTQLDHAVGLIGYSLRAQLFRRHFWTLSVWEDEKALMDFVRTTPHVQVMENLQGHMGAAMVVRWTLKGSSVPPDWKGALLRYRKETNSE